MLRLVLRLVLRRRQGPARSPAAGPGAARYKSGIPLFAVITPMPRYYDPNHAPDPQAWLALDSEVRIAQAEVFHKKRRIHMPGPKAHAVFHAIVENQIAEDVVAVVRAVPRLMAQGLSRHDAIHAIGWVLAQHLHEVMTSDQPDEPAVTNARYAAEVERLQAQDWLSQGGDDDE